MADEAQDSQNDKTMVGIPKHPLGSPYYVLSTSFFNREKAPHFPGLVTIIVGKVVVSRLLDKTENYECLAECL